eukprot:gnl/MRDRNA2_/MRDRNA2_120352_c0_seq1.p1 gnl/MRDRNA2_/MRDRNA2_120352_c0~~gnl/MRDRNA2_/MRDRNA2_120352_c0_seq1.p1  ORF type:complete len:477 (+),score=79.94 gnl/MRDRNA2_/MRDRNA2_120352_c0_seq1:120-1550(+)
MLCRSISIFQLACMVQAHDNKVATTGDSNMQVLMQKLVDRVSPSYHSGLDDVMLKKPCQLATSVRDRPLYSRHSQTRMYDRLSCNEGFVKKSPLALLTTPRAQMMDAVADEAGRMQTDNQKPPLDLADLGSSTGYYRSNGCNVYLQGAIHGNPLSAMEVEALMRHNRLKDILKCVVVELDLDRYWYLQKKRIKKNIFGDGRRKAWQVIRDIVTDDAETRKGEAILGYLLGRTMRLGESFNLEQGADFVSAIEAAEELEIPMALADQSQNQTVDKIFAEFSLRRLPSHILSLPDDLKFLSQTLLQGANGRVSLLQALARLPKPAKIFIAAFLALAVSSILPFSWNVAAQTNDFIDAIAEVEKVALAYILICFPSVLQVLFAERDISMLRTIDGITRNISASRSDKTSPGGNGEAIIAVVGLAHINSMLNIVNDAELRRRVEMRIDKVASSSESDAESADNTDIVYPSQYDDSLNPFR